MNCFDVKDALKTIQLLVDTRERDTKAFRRRIERIELPYKRQKLDFGDY
jgi:ERCC4-type nuclease